MLEISELAKSFGSRVLWEGLNWTFMREGMTAVVGSSGSGKSTLLNCLGTLDRPTGGRILWNGKDVAAASGRQRRRMRKSDLGYLFQNYALVEHATVRQNLNYAIHGAWPWKRDDFNEELRQVGLEGRGNDPIHRLSGSPWRGSWQRSLHSFSLMNRLVPLTLKTPRWLSIVFVRWRNKVQR